MTTPTKAEALEALQELIYENWYACHDADLKSFTKQTAEAVFDYFVENRAALSAGEWQPIETVPSTDSDDDPIPVLLGTKHNVAIGSAFNRKDGSKRARASFCLGIDWTHWQPLPTPPQGDA